MRLPKEPRSQLPIPPVPTPLRRFGRVTRGEDDRHRAGGKGSASFFSLRDGRGTQRKGQFHVERKRTETENGHTLQAENGHKQKNKKRARSTNAHIKLSLVGLFGALIHVLTLSSDGHAEVSESCAWVDTFQAAQIKLLSYCVWTKSGTTLNPWQHIVCWVFTGESFQGVLGRAGVCPSTVRRGMLSKASSLDWRLVSFVARKHRHRLQQGNFARESTQQLQRPGLQKEGCDGRPAWRYNIGPLCQEKLLLCLAALKSKWNPKGACASVCRVIKFNSNLGRCRFPETDSLTIRVL